MPHRQPPPDLASILVQQVQEARKSAQQQPLVINVGEGGIMTLVLGGSATTTVYQIKS